MTCLPHVERLGLKQDAHAGDSRFLLDIETKHAAPSVAVAASRHDDNSSSVNWFIHSSHTHTNAHRGASPTPAARLTARSQPSNFGRTHDEVGAQLKVIPLKPRRRGTSMLRTKPAFSGGCCRLSWCADRPFSRRSQAKKAAGDSRRYCCTCT